MSAIDNFQYFVKYIFPIGIFAFGLIGNTLGIIVLCNRDLNSIGPKRTYMSLFLCDSFVLLQLVGTYFQLAFNLYIASLTDFSCKLWNYCSYAFGIISPYLIVYISLERCISITRPAWKFFLRKNKNQSIYFILVTLACMLYYTPVALYYERSSLSDDGSCNFSDANAQLFISYMDLIMRVILPFFLMIICSATLTYSLFKSRRRVVENFLAEENQTFNRELRLAVTSLSLNLIYIVTQLPISIIMFQADYFSYFYLEFSSYICYLSYAIDFYIILATNSLVRSKFVSLFRNKTTSNTLSAIRIHPQTDAPKIASEIADPNS